LTHNPSGTDRLRLSVLMREGINLSNQLIGYSKWQGHA